MVTRVVAQSLLWSKQRPAVGFPKDIHNREAFERLTRGAPAHSREKREIQFFVLGPRLRWDER